MTFASNLVDDLEVFFQDFGVIATWNGTTFSVIFHNEYEAVILFAGEIESRNPYAEVRDSDIVGAKGSDSFTVNGTAYKIKGPPKPDGTGITILELSKD